VTEKRRRGEEEKRRRGEEEMTILGQVTARGQFLGFQLTLP
jgi:hypothetical protein